MHKIVPISPKDPKASILFKLLDQHNQTHCPPEQCNLKQPDELLTNNITLLGLYYDEELVGMCGLKIYPSYGEITRLFVMDKMKGKGFGYQLMLEIEQLANKKGVQRLKLETSDGFVAAVNLYLSMGYKKCNAFGEYLNNPVNSYYEKEL